MCRESKNALFQSTGLIIAENVDKLNYLDTSVCGNEICNSQKFTVVSGACGPLQCL